MGDFDFNFGDFSLGGLGDSGTGQSSFPSGLNLGGAEAPAAATQDFSLGAAPLSMPDVNIGGAAGAPADAGGAAPKSFGSIAKDAVGDVGGFAKGVLPFAQLGMAGFGMKNAMDAQGAARQQASILHRQQENQQRATAPLVAFGEQQLNRSAAGTINPAIQAKIDQWAQAQKIKARQLFAHGHITDSTMMNSVLADIDAKAEAMAAGDIHLMEQEGISALHAASGAATAGAGTAQTEQSQLDNLISEANKALASLSGQQ